ncbi:response regulator transcription factor [Clostridium lundense]|uniref:response regulator transcription factor n=1 Tax=Clostridium lundense TaxID=319475 RepID=UPI000485EDCA|nr:response regulator transcription factor [Clostridium lundense]
MNSILLVEDDESLNRGISFKLIKEGYKVFSAVSLNEAEKVIDSEKIDLILLDINLPDGSGFDFCNKIRKSSDVLIIFLTACDQEVDIVTGYDIGADDYVTKPFSLMVLISKIKAILKRKQGEKVCNNIFSGDIIFYPEELRVFKNNKELILSKTEIKLFKYLICNAEQVVTKAQLLNELWDNDGNFIDDNTIAVNIRRLREKIEENPSNPKYIKNIRGIGYTWAERCVSR